MSLKIVFQIICTSTYTDACCKVMLMWWISIEFSCPACFYFLWKKQFQSQVSGEIKHTHLQYLSKIFKSTVCGLPNKWECSQMFVTVLMLIFFPDLGTFYITLFLCLPLNIVYHYITLSRHINIGITTGSSSQIFLLTCPWLSSCHHGKPLSESGLHLLSQLASPGHLWIFVCSAFNDVTLIIQKVAPGIFIFFISSLLLFL